MSADLEHEGQRRVPDGDVRRADRTAYALAARIALGAGLVLTVVTVSTTYYFLKDVYWLATGVDLSQADRESTGRALWSDVPEVLIAWTLTVVVWFVAGVLLGRRSLEPGPHERRTGARVLLVLWLALIGPMVSVWLYGWVLPLLGVRRMSVALLCIAGVYVGVALLAGWLIRRSAAHSRADDEETAST